MSGQLPRSYGSMDEPTIGFAIPQQSTSSSFDAAGFRRTAEAVSSSIFAIAKHANTLEKTLKTIGGKFDSKHVRDAVHIVQTTANETIKATTRDLESLNRMVRNRQEPGGQEKVKVAKLSSDFSANVKRYTDLQKQIVAKLKVTYLPQHRPSLQYENETDDRQALVGHDQGQALADAQQLQETLEFEQGLLLEREERIRQIETDIIDVNDIMKQLGGMVQEQGENIDSIERNIEEAHEEVVQGTQELQKAATYQTTRRKRLFCLLMVGLVLLIIVIIVLVTSLKK